MSILGDRGNYNLKLKLLVKVSGIQRKLSSIYFNGIQASSNRIIASFPIYRDLFHSRLKKSLSQRERS